MLKVYGARAEGGNFQPTRPDTFKRIKGRKNWVENKTNESFCLQ